MVSVQVTAVHFSDGADKVYAGGIDNVVKVWDLRKGEMVMMLEGHSDTVTGMSLSPDGSYLLTNSMDCTLRIWDMWPYAPQVSTLNCLLPSAFCLSAFCRLPSAFRLLPSAFRLLPSAFCA